MIRFACPICKTSFQCRDQDTGAKVACPSCGQRLQIPDLPPVANTALGQPLPAPNKTVLGNPEPEISVVSGRKAEVDDDNEYGPGGTKYCHECGQKIRVLALICPKCGVRQHDRDEELGRSSDWRNGIKIPVLISAISNIVVGLIWLSTCFFFVFTIPMVILCIFEFLLWAEADKLSARQLNVRAKTLGIFEIVVGLFNTVTLICGIIVLINSGKLADHYDE